MRAVNNLYLAFSVVFPLFCMMGLGYLLKSLKVFDDEFLVKLNNLGFKVFLPVSLFVSIYKSDFEQFSSPKLIIFAVVCELLAFIALMIFVPRFEKSDLNRGVIVQGVFRSNLILFGFPITASLYGDENTSLIAIVMAFIIPLANVISTIALESFSTKKTTITSLLKSLAKNPLIIGVFIAFFFVLTKIRLPDIVFSTITDVSKVTTPLTLMALGGSFKFNSLGAYPKQLAFSAFGKLILVPVIVIAIGIFLGFRDISLVAILCVFASPTAVSSYTMAQNIGANDELAGQIVVVSSTLSVVTIFFWITFLMQYNFI